mgnify:CR=1 FL=1
MCSVENFQNKNQELEYLAKKATYSVEDGEIVAIKYLVQSDGKTYPPSIFPNDDRILKGFVWRENEQPKNKEDIFTNDNQKKTKDNISKNLEQSRVVSPEESKNVQEQN